MISLISTADPNSTFNRWLGSPDCQDGVLFVDRDLGCVAEFLLQPTPTHALTISRSGSGSGTITSTPAGIVCGSDCSETFNEGALVDLIAIPDTSSLFDGWSGDPDCIDGSVTMVGDVQCTASFRALIELPFEGALVMTSTEEWKNVALDGTFTSMVAVCTPSYTVGQPPLAVRIRNANGSSFDLRIVRLDGLSNPLFGIRVYCLVTSEGIYTVSSHGVTMEAVRLESTTTDGRGAWVGTPSAFVNTYNNPVVLGQIMTANDPLPSLFWSRGSTVQDRPSYGSLWVGKHVGEDPNRDRAKETIGYVVFEAGTGAIGGLRYEAGVGAAAIQGFGNSPPYSYENLNEISFPVVVLSIAGMKGGNGGWPVIYETGSPQEPGQLQLAIDEDRLSDQERSHVAEEVAYFLFENAGTLFADSLESGDTSAWTSVTP